MLTSTCRGSCESIVGMCTFCSSWTGQRALYLSCCESKRTIAVSTMQHQKGIRCVLFCLCMLHSVPLHIVMCKLKHKHHAVAFSNLSLQHRHHADAFPTFMSAQAECSCLSNISCQQTHRAIAFPTLMVSQSCVGAVSPLTGAAIPLAVIPL